MAGDYDKDRLSDYVDVPARIAEFRTKHPEGSLQPATTPPHRSPAEQGRGKCGVDAFTTATALDMTEAPRGV